MDLNYLRAFFEVAKSGGFGAAAKRLHISQSALSRSVALLEEQAGAQLLERSAKGVVLTKMGDRIFRHCEEVFQLVQHMSRICREQLETCEGPFHFATTDHIYNYLLPQPLLSFRQQYPKAIPSAFISTPDEILEKLLQKDCEFTLSFAKVVAPQVEFEALREEPMALVVRSDIWTASSGSVTSRLNKILDQHGYISSVGAHLQTRPTRVLKELFGRMPKIGLEVNGQESQKRICMAGGGVAYLSRFMVAREIEAGLLQEINVGQGHVFKLWLATRRGQELTTGSRVFIERLRGL